MKNGIQLITQEREEQIVKHGITISQDVEFNSRFQLIEGAISLLEESPHLLTSAPYKWDIKRWEKMITKPYEERLVIAGALIADEIDRLNN